MLISNSIKIDNGLSEIIKDTINTINVDAINIKYLDIINNWKKDYERYYIETI